VVAQKTEAELHAELQQARTTGNVPGQAAALFDLARAARGRGDRPAAVELYQQAGLLWQQLKSWKNMLSTLNNLAAVLIDMEDYEPAYKSARAATELAQKLGDSGALAMAVNTLGSVANNTGDHEAARTAYTKSLELAKSAGDPVRAARALYNLSWVAFITGDYGEARRASLQGAEALGDGVDPLVQAYLSMLGGRLDIRQHVYDRAQHRLGWAARTFHYAGEDEGAALASFAFGAAEFLAGNRSEGRRRIEATFQGIRLNRNRQATAQRLIGLSRLAAAAGAVEDAQAFGQLALNIGTHLSDPRIEGRARQLLSGASFAGAADAGITHATVELDIGHAPGERAEAPGAGDGADLKWMEHDFGVAPPPVGTAPADAPLETEHVGSIPILDLRQGGPGWSIRQDVAQEMGVANNRDAEASLQAVLRRRDPLLLSRLEFESELSRVGIVSSSHEDIRAAAAWLASMFKSAEGA
jgi:tetratricopeptide (TPR) repeat protein